MGFEPTTFCMASRTLASDSASNDPANKPFSAVTGDGRKAWHSPGNHGGFRTETGPTWHLRARIGESRRRRKNKTAKMLFSSKCRCPTLCCRSSSAAGKSVASLRRRLLAWERGTLIRWTSGWPALVRSRGSGSAALHGGLKPPPHHRREFSDLLTNERGAATPQGQTQQAGGLSIRRSLASPSTPEASITVVIEAPGTAVRKVGLCAECSRANLALVLSRATTVPNLSMRASPSPDDADDDRH